MMDAHSLSMQVKLNPLSVRFQTPLLEDKSSQWKLALGILNCLFLGVGVIVAGKREASKLWEEAR